MEDEKLFQIGDVARMFHLSPGSLRHYEQAGLLKPEYIDAQTGYRYYSVRQFEVLNTIRYLRALDMPIRQIEDFLKNRDIDVIENKLLKQKELIERKQRELALIERKIDHRLQQLRDAMNSELDVIQRKTLPACRMVVVKDSLQPQSYLDLEYAIRRLTENQAESVVFLGKVGVGISKERCVSIRFCGSHKEAGERYKKLMEYMEKEKLQAADFSREITMIDYGITNNTDKFVTENCIPVKEFG